MVKNVTVVGDNFISPAILKDEKLYMVLGHNVLIPFETNVKFEVVEVDFANFGLVMHRENKKNELRIKSLNKKIEENYSDSYMDKYLKQLFIEEPDFAMVSKIVSIHGKYLDDIFEKNKWSDANKALIDKFGSGGGIEKAIEREKLFYQYFLEFISENREE